MELDLHDFTPIEVSKMAILKRDFSWTATPHASATIIEVKLFQGEIANYVENADGLIHIYFDHLTLKVTKPQFDDMVTPLPWPPEGLCYRSMDDAFDIEEEPFWIYDVETEAFMQASAFPTAVMNMDSCIDISEAYNRENYGITWVVLTAETE